jgi:hypothetical protein
MQQNLAAEADGLRGAVASALAAGMRLVVTVTNHDAGPARTPSHPPASSAERDRFRARLGTLLDALPRGTVVMVENEEVAPKFWSGSMRDYRTELDAVVEAAHRRGLAVTDGGITNEPLKLMVWQDLVDRGKRDRARQFADRAFALPAEAWIRRDLGRVPFGGLSRSRAQEAWDRARQVIPMLAASDVDAVDFHWYTDDDTVLRDAVEYLRRATGKPVVTTEIGQYSADPAVVTGHLRTLVDELHVPLVVWFDTDGQPAVGLHDSPAALRPNGIAFRTFVSAHPSAR